MTKLLDIIGATASKYGLFPAVAMLQFFETQEQCRSLKQEITQSLIIDDPIIQNG